MGGKSLNILVVLESSRVITECNNLCLHKMLNCRKYLSEHDKIILNIFFKLASKDSAERVVRWLAKLCLVDRTLVNYDVAVVHPSSLYMS